jgi:hypothetical protein
MNEYPITKKQQLRELIEKNYEEFTALALQMDSKFLFENAGSIAAVHDVYHLMITHDSTDDEETEYLLAYENPLDFLAEEWKEKSADRDTDFALFLIDIVKGGDYTEISVMDELRSKYGRSVPANTAALLEIIDIGKKILHCRDEIDYGDSEFERKI